MSSISSILIPETREISNKSSDRHTVYLISVSGPVRSFTVQKRFSDFLALHQALLELDSRVPPEELPKKAFKIAGLGLGESAALIEDRRVKLERYLQAILFHKDPIWRNSKIWLEFFNLPSTATLSFKDASSSGFRWIQEYESLYSFCIQIRSVLNERDRFAVQGESTLAHSKKFQARKAIKQAQDSLKTLVDSLGADGVAVGELERRRNLVRSIEQDLKQLEEVHLTSSLAVPIGGTSASSARDQLFHSSISSSPSASTSKRKFGTSVTEESEKTRMLDEKGLIQLQKMEIQAQDKVVVSLGQVVERQKEISLVISKELDLQNALLEQTEDLVDRVEVNLRMADKKAKRILKG